MIVSNSTNQFAGWRQDLTGITSNTFACVITLTWVGKIPRINHLDVDIMSIDVFGCFYVRTNSIASNDHGGTTHKGFGQQGGGEMVNMITKVVCEIF